MRLRSCATSAADSNSSWVHGRVFRGDRGACSFQSSILTRSTGMWWPSQWRQYASRRPADTGLLAGTRRRISNSFLAKDSTMSSRCAIAQSSSVPFFLERSRSTGVLGDRTSDLPATVCEIRVGPILTGASTSEITSGAIIRTSEEPVIARLGNPEAAAGRG